MPIGMEMFKLDRKQAVALTLAVIVGVIGGLVGFALYSAVGTGGNWSLGYWITRGASSAWHSPFPSACVGAFVAAALFYIRLLTAKDNE
jgi:H+/Cl- antiporter ClcA